MTTPSGSCFFQEKVYMKLLMHFSKYASESVCGVLLGTTSENRSCNTTTVVVDDCLPLSHYSALPSPMLQVGIQLSQTIAKKQSLAIVGCYIAGQCLDEPKDASWWLVDQVQLYGNTCKLLLVSDNRKLAPDIRTSQVPLRFFQRLVDSHRWEEWKDEKLGIIPIDWLERTEQLLTDKEAMESFHDFEDHCLEPNCNWMNSHVSQKFMARH